MQGLVIFALFSCALVAGEVIDQKQNENKEVELIREKRGKFLFYYFIKTKNFYCLDFKKYALSYILKKKQFRAYLNKILVIYYQHQIYTG